MSIRLDPRRLSALKLLAAEAGVRPGELVTTWVEERLDAARAGGGGARPVAPSGVPAAEFAGLAARVDELARRLDALANMATTKPATTASAGPAAAEGPMAAGASKAAGRPKSAEAPEAAEAPKMEPRRRGRPRKARPDPAAGVGATAAEPRVALHEEIVEVIRQRGPSTAAEIARAIVERGRYAAPRSSRPLDAATVNSRVSNPAYRSRFARSDGRIGLA